ncbi:MAG: hypothetical protein ACMUIS_09255 [bacterium]
MKRTGRNPLCHALSAVLAAMMLLALHPCVARAQREKATQNFLQANQAYENERYADAASLYEEVIGCGFHSGAIYYNLGNCYTKMGRIGPALVYYRNAERFMPRDGDLRFNLQYVLDQRKDRIETRERIPFARVFFFWYYWLSLREILVIFLVFNLLLWTLSLILLYRHHELLRWARILSLCLFLIFGATLVVKVYAQGIIRQGVVTVQEATVRSGNGIHHSPLFILHEGAECRVDDEAEGWMKILLTDGKIGWISSSAIRIIGQ